jgi:hypothetical protein
MLAEVEVMLVQRALVVGQRGCFCAGGGAAACLGGGAGADMENRSPMLLVFAGGLLAAPEVDVTGEAAEKSPQSPPKLSLRGAGAACGIGGDVGFAGAAGFMSKNEPPLRDDFVADVCRLWPGGDVRPANGEGLAAGC